MAIGQGHEHLQKHGAVFVSGMLLQKLTGFQRGCQYSTWNINGCIHAGINRRFEVCYRLYTSDNHTNLTANR